MIPLTLDGVSYPGLHVLSLNRSFSVLDGENAGRVMTGTMERDIIGTYYNYTMEIDADDASPDEYDAFYEIISAPQDSHALTVPYGQHLYTFQAYITGGDDALRMVFHNMNRWGGLKINFIAMEPARVAL